VVKIVVPPDGVRSAGHEVDQNLQRRYVQLSATTELLIEPALRTEPAELDGLRIDLLRRATEVYLGLAYPAGRIPEVVQRRLAWRDDAATDVRLSGPPFEKAGKAAGGGGAIYALRLGNHRYPHMKLQIQPWLNEAGFMLSVNSHDQVTGIDLSSVDAQAFRELQAENQRLKEAIEESWDRAGLPTFNRYLRDYIKSRAVGGASGDVQERADTGGAPDLSPLP
jgi:hypothetical protein